MKTNSAKSTELEAHHFLGDALLSWTMTRVHVWGPNNREKINGAYRVKPFHRLSALTFLKFLKDKQVERVEWDMICPQATFLSD